MASGKLGFVQFKHTKQQIIHPTPANTLELARQPNSGTTPDFLHGGLRLAQ